MPHLSSAEVYNANERSWLNKLMKSKVDWFMAPTGWLMTRRPGPPPRLQPPRPKGRERRINQSIISPLTTAIHWKSVLQLQPNHFWNDHCRRPASKFKGSHLYPRLSTFLPLSLSLSLSVSVSIHAKGGGFFVCCSICLTHVTALIYARDERAGGNRRSSARSCARKRYNSFREM